MMALVAGDMNAVNAVILGRMQSDIPLIPELAGHLIAGGGKRMRPMLTLASARAIGYTGTRHHLLAAAVEFIHTATLLHDDVVDGSDLRRGRRTANIIWGNPASVLVGDFLFSRSFELMVDDGSLKVLKILSNASAVIAEGEVNQLTAARRIDLPEDRYLAIIDAKTAALFAAACRIAAVVAERPDGEEAALDAYGRNLGIAFQLVDDAIDYVSDAGTMGKDAGDDFREGKMTLPVILAHARGSADDRRFWKDAIEGRRASDEDLAHAVALIRQTRAIDDTLARGAPLRPAGDRRVGAVRAEQGEGRDGRGGGVRGQPGVLTATSVRLRAKREQRLDRPARPRSGNPFDVTPAASPSGAAPPPQHPAHSPPVSTCNVACPIPEAVVQHRPGRRQEPVAGHAGGDHQMRGQHPARSSTSGQMWRSCIRTTPGRSSSAAATAS